MKKVLKDILEPIIFILLLVLFCIIFPNKIELSDVVFYLTPTIGGFIYRRLIRTNSVQKLFLKLRYYISHKPIMWSFSGEYVVEGRDSKEIIYICKSILEDISENAYETKLVIDINKPSRFLAYLSGVRIDIKYTELLNCISIKFESESPMKTFVRQHYNKLIQVFFEQLDNSLGSSVKDNKITLEVNRVKIPISSVQFINDEGDITEFYIGIKEKKSKVAYQNGGFTCISNDIISCYNAFTKYVLTNDI